MATFAIGCGAGFDARVMATTPAHLKRRFGKSAYFAQAIRLALEIEAVPFRITVDGQVIETDASIALIANMGELVPGLVGPRLPIIPDDGLLDLIVVGARGPLHGMKGLIDQLFRTHLGGGSGSDSLRVRGRESSRSRPTGRSRSRSMATTSAGAACPRACCPARSTSSSLPDGPARSREAG